MLPLHYLFLGERPFLTHCVAEQPNGVNKLSGGVAHTGEENKLFSGTFEVPSGTGTVAILIAEQVLLHIKAGSLQILARLHLGMEY